MNSIVSGIVFHMEQISREIHKAENERDPYEDPTVFSSTVPQQIQCLSVLLRNYPEMSILVLSYKLRTEVTIPETCSKFLPALSQNETFLTFFLKYACSLYNFSMSSFLEVLIQKSQTPIMVEFHNELLPLSAYNEVLILSEMINLIETTLSEPEKFLKTLYTVHTWCIFTQMATSLLRLPFEEKQKHFKSTIIESLHSLSLKAIEIFTKGQTQEEIAANKQVQMTYTLMARLAEVEVEIKASNILAHEKKPLATVLSAPNDLQWTYYILRNKQILLGKEHEHISLADLAKSAVNSDRSLPGNIRVEPSNISSKIIQGELVYCYIIVTLYIRYR